MSYTVTLTAEQEKALEWHRKQISDVPDLKAMVQYAVDEQAKHYLNDMKMRLSHEIAEEKTLTELQTLAGE